MINSFRFLFFIIMCFCITASACGAQTLPLVQNKKTDYSIALAHNAIPAEKNAAQQLQMYLEQMTGVKLAVIDESKTIPDQPCIWIGAGEKVQQLLPKINWEQLTSDTIIIKSVGQQLILAGGKPRGTLYAVYRFLEEELGCRWWSVTEKEIPTRNTVIISPQNALYTPTLQYRDFTRKKEIRYDPHYAESGIVLRANGLNNIPDENWGGRNDIKGFIHSFLSLLPVEKYFSSHPEWYSDPANGYKPATSTSAMPGPNRTQLCYAALGLEEELTKNAAQWLKENPDIEYLSLSIADNRGYCRDADSMALAEKEGSQSAPLIKFVNSVSRSLRQIKPDIKIITLAYYYTVKPPKTIRPDDNVYILYAPIMANFGHPLNSSKNKETRDNLIAWQKITDKIIVWNYVGNFFYPMLPYPNWDSIGQDIKDLANSGVKGIFDEGPLNLGDIRSDFPEMRTWIIGHMLWNPHNDMDELMNTFLQGYYGAAAPYLKEYIHDVQQSFYQHPQKLNAFNDQFDYLDIDLLNRSTELFDLAENAVKQNPTFLKRVKRERLAIDFSWLHRYDILKLQARGEDKVFLGPDDPKMFMDNLLSNLPNYQQNKYRFGQTTYNYADFRTRLSSDFTEQEQIPTFLNHVAEKNIYSFEQGTFTIKPWIKSVFLTEDEKATDGKALAFLPSATEINAHLLFKPFSTFLAGKTADIYVAVRVDTKNTASSSGDIFEISLHDMATDRVVASKTIDFKSASDENYQWISLKDINLKTQMNLDFKTFKSDAVEKIYVDKVVLAVHPDNLQKGHL